jgi:putative addiction module component (TIGR02574 family)
MGIETLIDNMSRNEQIAALQLIWDRLATSAEGTEPPEWHGDVLAERLAAVENGSAKFVDWPDAKKRLRERHG